MTLYSRLNIYALMFLCMYIHMCVCMCKRVEIMCHSLMQSYKMFTIVVCTYFKGLHMLSRLKYICCERESRIHIYVRTYMDRCYDHVCNEYKKVKCAATNLLLLMLCFRVHFDLLYFIIKAFPHLFLIHFKICNDNRCEKK